MRARQAVDNLDARGTGGDAVVRLFAIAGIILLQGVEIVGGYALLAFPFVWTAHPVIVAALAASVGSAAARARRAESARLVTISALRLGGVAFLFTVLVTVIVIGPVATVEAVADYARDPRTAGYLLNLLAWPQFSLPGVFEFNDLRDVVNRNMWVAPVALLCLCAIWLDPLKPLGRLAPATLGAAIAFSALLFDGLAIPPGTLPSVVDAVLRGDGLSALLGGMIGVSSIRLHGRVRIKGWLAALAAGLLVALALVGNASSASTGWFRVVSAPAAAYLALFLSGRRWRAAPVAARLQPHLAPAFLLSFPVQQLVAQQELGRSVPALAYALGLVATSIMVALFGYVLGLPALGPDLRERVSRRPEAAPRPRHLPAFRLDPASALLHLAIGAVLVALCLGVMAMLYVAFSPDPGGL